MSEVVGGEFVGSGSELAALLDFVEKIALQTVSRENLS
jgi:hypothetical protein